MDRGELEGLTEVMDIFIKNSRQGKYDGIPGNSPRKQGGFENRAVFGKSGSSIRIYSWLGLDDLACLGRVAGLPIVYFARVFMIF
jgi:hypothetical protein